MGRSEAFVNSCSVNVGSVGFEVVLDLLEIALLLGEDVRSGLTDAGAMDVANQSMEARCT